MNLQQSDPDSPASDPNSLAVAPGPPARPRRSRRGVWAENLAVAVITLLLIFVLLEIGLRLFAPQIVPDTLAGAPQVQIDLFAGLYVADPATTYRNTPGARIPYQYGDEINTNYNVNSQGLREDHDVGPPAAGTSRLLSVGDSFTFGVGVDAQQAFPFLLNGSKAAGGGPVESINGAVNGYGTDNEAAWLTTYGWALRPRLVLVGFYVGNDVRDVMLGIDKTMVTPEGHLVGTDKARQTLARSAEAASKADSHSTDLERWLATNSHAFVYLSLQGHKLFPGLVQTPKVADLGVYDTPSIFLKAEPAELTAGWEKTLGILDAMRAAARAHGAEMAVVAIPTREQVEDAGWQGMQKPYGLTDAQLERDKPQRRLAEWSKRTGAPLIDLLPDFHARGNNTLLYFRTDPHFNPDGHIVATQLIRDGMVRLGLFSR
jgi:hypothetical protein